MEPDGVAAAFNAHGDWTGQGGVELLDGAALVDQLTLEGFARLRVEYCHLLFPRVEIAANKCHEGGLLSEGVVTVSPPEPTHSGETVLMTSVMDPQQRAGHSGRGVWALPLQRALGSCKNDRSMLVSASNLLCSSSYG